jgi:hypothetical protein
MALKSTNLIEILPMDLHALTSKSEITNEPLEIPEAVTPIPPVIEPLPEPAPPAVEGEKLMSAESSRVNNVNDGKDKPAPLIILSDKVEPLKRRENLFKLYGEICNSRRALTDVRFKLLGLIPVVSGVVLFSLLSDKQDGPSSFARMGISIFGLLITIALFIYDRRNSELYFTMFDIGKQIEADLGIMTGVFSNHPEPLHKWINHKIAVNLIYGVSIAAWLAAFLAICLGPRK